MRTSFLHLADTRLGYRDPNDPAVFEQVASQFRFAVDFAVDQRASFVVFSGDLFDSPGFEPDTLRVALRGLSKLAEKNIGAIAIRGRSDTGGEPGVMTWHDMLAQEGLLAALDVGIGDGQLELHRWERREGRGSYLDLGRCRVFGLRYFGSMTSSMLPALSKAVAALDNRETDFRLVLLHTPLEHLSAAFGPKLAYSDVLMLRRQVDYVALGGSDSSYEAEGWVYNPGPSGFLHVTVDTAVRPKHAARHVPYPAALLAPRPAAPAQSPTRRELEERVFDELLASEADQDERNLRRDVLRLVTESMWGVADPVELHARLIEVASRGQDAGHAA